MRPLRSAALTLALGSADWGTREGKSILMALCRVLYTESTRWLSPEDLGPDLTGIQVWGPPGRALHAATRRARHGEATGSAGTSMPSATQAADGRM